MDQIVIKANARTETGKAAVNRIRRAGKIPAVAYDKTGASENLEVDAAEFLKAYKDVTDTTVVIVDVDGKTFEAFIKTVDFNIVTEKALHIDFYRVASNEKLTRKIAVKVQGNAVGIRHGGALSLGASLVEVSCLPKYMPSKIVVDVSDLALDNSIVVGDLKFDGDVKVLTAADTMIATVKKA